MEAPLPELGSRVGNFPIKCIVDTGSQATIISEEIHSNIKTQKDIDVPELPVNNVSIMWATGIRSKKIHKQILLPCGIGDEVFYIPCFVVRNIPLTAILRSDFLEKYRALIDYDKYTIELRDTNRGHVEALGRSNNTKHTCGIKVVYNRHYD